MSQVRRGRPGPRERRPHQFLALRRLRQAMDRAGNRRGRGVGGGEAIMRQKTERAARQQGSSSLRENSSNGGKTIRTFWLHSRFGERECQEQIEAEIKRLYSIGYRSFTGEVEKPVFPSSSPHNCRVLRGFRWFS